MSGSKLEHLERKIPVNMSCIIGMATVHDKNKRIIAVTSYNNDTIMGLDYRTGKQVKQLNINPVSVDIRPFGLRVHAAEMNL